jgi:hypothetical protein
MSSSLKVTKLVDFKSCRMSGFISLFWLESLRNRLLVSFYEDNLLISFCSNNFEILYIILFVGVVGGGGEGGN